MKPTIFSLFLLINYLCLCQGDRDQHDYVPTIHFTNVPREFVVSVNKDSAVGPKGLTAEFWVQCSSDSAKLGKTYMTLKAFGPLSATGADGVAITDRMPGHADLVPNKWSLNSTFFMPESESFMKKLFDYNCLDAAEKGKKEIDVILRINKHMITGPIEVITNENAYKIRMRQKYKLEGATIENAKLNLDGRGKGKATFSFNYRLDSELVYRVNSKCLPIITGLLYESSSVSKNNRIRPVLFKWSFHPSDTESAYKKEILNDAYWVWRIINQIKYLKGQVQKDISPVLKLYGPWNEDNGLSMALTICPCDDKGDGVTCSEYLTKPVKVEVNGVDWSKN